jgi:diguanylate cyclase (GGDEF)-like protein/PAS domain S-box-containing protein
MVQSQLKDLPHLLCLLDFQGHIKQVNHSAWQQLGIMTEYLLMTTFMQWIHPDDFAHTQKALSALYTKKSERVIFESRWSNINGEYCWFFWMATASTTEQLVYLTGLKIDKPEQPSPAFPQKYSSQHCQLQTAIWEITNDPILITNTQLRILDANPACTTFMGYTSQELMGKSLQNFNTGQQNTQFYQDLRDTMRQKGCWQGSIWQRHKNRGVYLCQLKIQAYEVEEEIDRRYVVILEHNQNTVCFDPLTQLVSRQLFHHELQKSLAKAQRNKKFFALLLIGIDNMPVINTKYGNAVGDKFLCAIGELLKSSIRHSDTVARYDGDKFCVNLDEITKPQDAGLVAQILFFKLTQTFIFEEQEVQGLISIAIVVYPEDGTEVDSLETLAEYALQQAQQQGGNQCYFSNSFLRR